MTRLVGSISGFFDYWVVDFAVRRSDLILHQLSFAPSADRNLPELCCHDDCGHFGDCELLLPEVISA